MSEDVGKWLVDILEAIDHIDVHLGGQRDFTIYQNSITIQRAVEREIEIIGEATNRILKINDSIAISNARRGIERIENHLYNIISLLFDPLIGFNELIY